jgi:ketosteroid isomerase-like protein
MIRNRPSLGVRSGSGRGYRPRAVSDGVDAIHAYFGAIRARDVSALGVLFTDDAELVSGAGTFSGRDAIVGFYRDLAFRVDDLWPDPGPLIVDGDRVAVEIRLRMGGTTTLVADVFTLEQGRIASVTIYDGPQVTDTRTA